MRILGLDEAGRGSVLGPLVVGGFCCSDTDVEALRAAGADDSKALSHKRRVAVRESLGPLGEAEVIAVSATQIDAGNINHLEEDAFVALIERLRPGHVFIDAPVHPRAIPNFLTRLRARVAHLGPIGFTVEPKADVTYAVVGAASIFAKVARDAAVEQLGEVGSGYPSDPVTRAWIRRFLDSEQPLPDCVRSRWGTIDSLRQQSLF